MPAFYTIYRSHAHQTFEEIKVCAVEDHVMNFFPTRNNDIVISLDGTVLV